MEGFYDYSILYCSLAPGGEPDILAPALETSPVVHVFCLLVYLDKVVQVISQRREQHYAKEKELFYQELGAMTNCKIMISIH